MSPLSIAEKSGTLGAPQFKKCYDKVNIRRSLCRRRNARDHTGVSTRTIIAVSFALGFVVVGRIKIDRATGVQNGQLLMAPHVLLERAGHRFFLGYARRFYEPLQSTDHPARD